MSDGSVVQRLGESGQAKAVAFTTDGTRVAAMDADGMVNQWGVGGGKLIRAWKASDSYGFAVAYDPHKDVIVTGGDRDGKIKFWNRDTGKLLHCARADRNVVDAIAFVPDGSRFATGSWHSPARIWDSRTRKVLHTLRGHTGNVWDVSFSADGRLVASVSSEIKVWDGLSGRLPQTIPGGGLHVAFTRGAREVVTEDGRVVKVMRLGKVRAR